MTMGESLNSLLKTMNSRGAHLLLFVFFFIVMFAVPFVASAEEIIVKDELLEVMSKNGVDGAFVGYDVKTDRLILVNVQRARQRLNPASTFKIANSLIALETGVVRDENEIIPYRSDAPPLIKEWARDMSMREAIKLSNVPIYQELARRIGLARYHEWLTHLSYGNAEIGSVVDRFWLDGPLAISAVEEAHFVAKLAQRKLPLSRRAQDIVCDILKYETAKDYTLFAKTGWCRSCRPQIGWWVGWVQRHETVFAFALNIDVVGPEDLEKRIAVAKDILSKLGVI
jgi:beta-lactamase class D